MSKSFSSLNSLIDILKFDEHRKIRKEIKLLNKKSKFYDYGEGYFYQSLSKINLSGLRNSFYRNKILNINEYSRNKNILDIGTNTGFLLMEIDNNFKSAIGIDYNSNLIKIANKVKEYLNITNIQFECSDFFSFYTNNKFDLILSLANHLTFDKGIDDSKKYFLKVIDLLKENGILILESHHPNFENIEKFTDILELIMDKFKLINEGFYQSRNFYDNKRKFVILQLIKD